MCLCFCLSCNYSKLQKYVTGPNECLHFLFLMFDFGETGNWMDDGFFFHSLFPFIVPELFEQQCNNACVMFGFITAAFMLIG